MKLSCPHCGQPLETEQDATGLEVQCPACSRTFVAGADPLPGEQAAEPQVPLPAAAANDTGPENQPPGGLSDASLEDLRRATNFKLVKSNLRPAGIGSIVFGLIAIGLGASSIDQSPLNIGLLLIGIFLLAEGIWLVASPKPKGLIVDGVALIILGIWNIIVTINNAAASHGQPNTMFAVLGVFQIGIGIQSFKRYGKLKNLPATPPSAELLAQIEQTMKEINKAKAKEDESIIEFAVAAFMTTQAWKCRLTDGLAVFVITGGQDMIFARTADVSVTTRGKLREGKNVGVTLVVEGKTIKTGLKWDHYQRLSKWKGGAV